MSCMASLTASRPRMLKPAIRNTHINSQNTIVPMIAGTLRCRPMWCIESARPLWSAALCRPSFSDKRGDRLGHEAGHDVADHHHDDHGHDLAGPRRSICCQAWSKLSTHGVPRVVERGGDRFGRLFGDDWRSSAKAKRFIELFLSKREVCFMRAGASRPRR